MRVRLFTIALFCLLWGAPLRSIAQDRPPEEVPPRPTAGSDDAPSGGQAREEQTGPPPREENPPPAAPTEPALVPPRLRSAPDVTLPEGMELPEGENAVVLQVTILADGTVSAVEVVTGLGPAIDPLVREAAQAMVFEPARRNGEPIAATIQFRYRVAGSRETPRSPLPPNPFLDETPEDPSAAEAPSGTPAPAEGTAPAGEQPPSTAEVPDDEDETPAFRARAAIELDDPGAATKITLSADELQTVPGTFGEPLRVVATLPGVVRTPLGLPFFFVRGASFENSGFFVDGFQVPLLYHLAAGPAVINARLVKQLDFYPGGYPARLGRFSAGVISVETGPADVPSAHFEAEVDLFRASALAIVPFDEGRGKIAASARRSYFELILPLFTDSVSISYGDWQLRADYAFTDKISGSLFYFGSQDDFDISASLGAGVGDEQTRTGFAYGFHRLIGKLSFELPANLRLTWAANLGFDQTSFGRVDPGGANLSTALDATFLGQRVELFAPLSEHFQTSLGVDMLATQFRADTSVVTPIGIGEAPKPIPTPSSTRATVDPLLLNIAPYLQQVFHFHPLEITAALRFDYLRYGAVSQMFVDPRTVARVKLIDELTLKAATGLFTQPPQLFQADNVFGNPRLSPQRAWQSSGGFELDLENVLFVESQVFYSRMFDLPRATNGFANDPNDPTRREIFVADGSGESYGLELLVRRQAQEGLYGWLSYTLSWSNRFLGDGPSVPFFFDQRHTLSLVASYAIDGWRFGARFQLSTGRPTRPVLGCEEDLDADRCAAIRGGLTDRLPAFNQLDIRIDRDFTFGNALKGSIYLDIINVYNADNAEALIYQWDGRDRAKLPSLPILPTLGVRLEYDP